MNHITHIDENDEVRRSSHKRERIQDDTNKNNKRVALCDVTHQQNIQNIQQQATFNVNNNNECAINGNNNNCNNSNNNNNKNSMAKPIQSNKTNIITAAANILINNNNNKSKTTSTTSSSSSTTTTSTTNGISRSNSGESLSKMNNVVVNNTNNNNISNNNNNNNFVQQEDNLNNNNLSASLINQNSLRYRNQIELEIQNFRQQTQQQQQTQPILFSDNNNNSTTTTTTVTTTTTTTTTTNNNNNNNNTNILRNHIFSDFSNVQHLDIDAQYGACQILCAEYAEEIFDNARKSQWKTQPIDYMSQQQELRPGMRALLIDWIVDIGCELGVKNETIYLSINILDRYLSIEPVSRNEFQMIGACAFFIAAKYEEYKGASPSFIIQSAGDFFTVAQLLECECKMLKALNFALCSPTIKFFLGRYLIAVGDSDISHVAHLFGELSLLEYNLINYPPSIIAAVCVYLACLVLQKQWTSTLTYYCRVDVNDNYFQNCAKLIYDKFHTNEAENYSQTIKHKYAYVFNDIFNKYNNNSNTSQQKQQQQQQPISKKHYNNNNL